jgi:hypothetical protein
MADPFIIGKAIDIVLEAAIKYNKLYEEKSNKKE